MKIDIIKIDKNISPPAEIRRYKYPFKSMIKGEILVINEQLEN